MASKSKFIQGIIRWCEENPQDPFSAYLIQNYNDSEKARKEEFRRWKLISVAMENYGFRETVELARGLSRLRFSSGPNKENELP